MFLTINFKQIRNQTQINTVIDSNNTIFKLKKLIMGSEVIILPAIIAGIFGIFYLFISARNKERMALIEKGAEASIFYNKKQRTSSLWKIIILNLALLFMGVGVGIFIAYILHNQIGIQEGVAFPGTIFLMAGIGLFTGVKFTNNIINE